MDPPLSAVETFARCKFFTRSGDSRAPPFRLGFRRGIVSAEVAEIDWLVSVAGVFAIAVVFTILGFQF
jgi:hypothetical protein